MNMDVKLKRNSPSNNIPYSLIQVFTTFVIFITFSVIFLTRASIFRNKKQITMTETSTLHDCDTHYKTVPSKMRGVISYQAFCGDKPMTIQEWTEAIADDARKSQGIIQIIKEVPFKAVFFETKGCHQSNWNNKQFEFVLVDAPSLYSFAESNPDPKAFSEYLSGCRYDGCTFPNLGGDAQLIAPKAIEQSNRLVQYSHLAAFCRQAPANQVANLWKLAAQEYKRQVETFQTRTVWFSTSGTGIAWLHFRLASLSLGSTTEILSVSTLQIRNLIYKAQRFLYVRSVPYTNLYVGPGKLVASRWYPSAKWTITLGTSTI